jgi:hypothetical protein
MDDDVKVPLDKQNEALWLLLVRALKTLGGELRIDMAENLDEYDCYRLEQHPGPHKGEIVLRLKKVDAVS